MAIRLWRPPPRFDMHDAPPAGPPKHLLLLLQFPAIAGVCFRNSATYASCGSGPVCTKSSGPDMPRLSTGPPSFAGPTRPSSAASVPAITQVAEAAAEVEAEPARKEEFSRNDCRAQD